VADRRTCSSPHHRLDHRRAALVIGVALAVAGCGVPRLTNLDMPRDVSVTVHDLPPQPCSGGCDECQRCVNNTCMPVEDGAGCENGTCHGGACCTGCWDGQTCQGGQDSTGCGQNGAACQSCAEGGTACVSGSCIDPCGWAQVAVGGSFACALRPDHSLSCWGLNDQGQLGLGSLPGTPTPVQVTDSTRWQQISAGFAHFCAVLDDGTLWCWGLNDHGEIGTGDMTNLSSPNRVGSDQTWAQVACGYYHTCAVRTDGTLWCWGRNDGAQLGVGDSNDRPLPAQVGSDRDWSLVSAGGAHTCAVKQDGRLFCWGTNSSGTLGLGQNDGSFVQATPAQVGQDTGWSQVSAGGSHACAVSGLNGQQVFCWGDNGRGQLGLGDTNPRSSPAAVAGTGWSQVAAGGAFTCATNSGKLACWGDNGDGELGSGNAGGTQSQPTQVAGSVWDQVRTGSKSTCALQAGTLYCWGNNDNGMLGTGNTQASAQPVKVCSTMGSLGNTDGGPPPPPPPDMSVGQDAGADVPFDAPLPPEDMTPSNPGCPSPADCGNPACDGQGCGQHGRKCQGGQCICPGGQTTETSCGDGKDNDCDGLVDCADPDCNRKKCGSAGTDRCCGGHCTDTTFDENNCGGCGIRCKDPDGSGQFGPTCARVTDSDGVRGQCLCTLNAQCNNNPGQICRMNSTMVTQENNLCSCNDASGCDTGQRCLNVTGANFCTY
jgi:alpha-tubulin suppressor-like RCC1 family protein